MDTGWKGPWSDLPALNAEPCPQSPEPLLPEAAVQGLGPRHAAEHLPPALQACGLFPFPFPGARSGKRFVTPALERRRLEMNPEHHLLPPPSLPARGADAWKITRICKERGQKRRTGKEESWEAKINGFL